MKNMIKKFSFFLIFSVVLMLPISVRGLDSLTPSKNSNYKSYDYLIDKYNINIVVNENNTFDIEEDLTVYFNTGKHGIYRTIPLKNTVEREDGTKTKNKTRVSNVSVNSKYTTSIENGKYKIKIGDKNKYLTGEQHYNIKYKYNIGKDPLKEVDELYFNIIGTEWTDTVIGNVTFTIVMPRDFDESKLGFSAGKYGTSGTTFIDYTVEGKVIKGSYNRILEANEALTVRLELPEGYFVVKGFSDSPLVYILLIIPLLFLAVAVYLWNKYGKEDLVTETVEFYPPEGKNSLDVGFLYKGNADNNDIVSLLIYLANKGYLKIEEFEEKKILSKKKSFKIIKVKDYDGKDENERTFFRGLFVTGDEVTKDDLYNSFYKTLEKISSNKNRLKNKHEIFEKGTAKKALIVIVMAIVTLLIITLPEVFEYNYMDELPFIALILPFMMGNIPYLIIYIVGLISIVGMIVCAVNMRKRNVYGNEMLGKIRGLKHFLETAEKEKLEKMVNDDPEYFYNILPYTYVLGVSDKWIKKFEDISLKAPDWYDSPSAFDIIYFNSFVNSTMVEAKSVMASRPSSSDGGGGFSGGGFSGGGSGGGGGGSW